MLQPEPAGDVPFGPVSWYGVARPCALSGLAGTTMSQSVLSAAAAGADAAAEPDADGQGAGEAEADAGALTFAAEALAAAGAAWLPLTVGAALPLAAAEAQPRADCSIGIARGTAMRAARLFRRRRHADLCPLSIQSTSMWEVPCDAPGASP
jgi:hypothetical protein